MSSRSISWMQFPSKKVFSIEYFGETERGKTHSALTYPNPAICDTLSEGEVWQVAEKLGISLVFQARTFEEIEQFVNYCIRNPKIETVIIDSGADLREMAEARYLGASPEKMHPKTRSELKSKPAVYSPSHGAVEYRHVNNMIDDLINRVKAAQKYFVVTSRLKYEYEKDEDGKWIRTGELIHDGYNKFERGYGLSVRVRLVDGITDSNGKKHFEDHIFGEVAKNRFLLRRVQKPYFFDPTYHGLVEKGEIFEVFCKNYDEKSCDLNTCARCPRCERKNIVEEAKKYLIGIGEIKEVAQE